MTSFNSWALQLLTGATSLWTIFSRGLIHIWCSTEYLGQCLDVGLCPGNLQCVWVPGNEGTCRSERGKAAPWSAIKCLDFLRWSTPPCSSATTSLAGGTEETNLILSESNTVADRPTFIQPKKIFLGEVLPKMSRISVQ